MPDSIIQELWHLVPTVIYFFVGVILFGISIKLADFFLPFSLRKEIEEDENGQGYYSFSEAGLL